MPQLPKVITLPNPILRKISSKVEFPLSDADQLICQQMMDYIIESQKNVNDEPDKLRPGIGIAAPQIGINKRMFYVRVKIEDSEDEIFEGFYINPEFISTSLLKASLEHGEGCLSVDEDDEKIVDEGYVPRHFKVVMKAYSLFDKKEVTIIKTGFHAIVLQHEMDHLNGKLFIDRINKKDPWFKNEKMKLISR